MSSLRRHSLISNPLHPFYRAVLNRAVGLGYALPSFRVRGMQNRLVTDLVKAGIWSKLRMLYVLLNDAPNVDFCRIDWITPTRAAATGSPTFTSNGGVGSGYLATPWVLADHTAAGFSFQNGGWYCYVRTGGTNSSNHSFLNTTPTNGRRFRLLARTTPRQDVYWCVTDASPHNLQSGNVPSNTGYAMSQLSTTLKAYINGVDTGAPVGGNLEPDDGTVEMGSGLAGRTCGCVAITLDLTATQEANLNTIFRTNYALLL